MSHARLSRRGFLKAGVSAAACYPLGWSGVRRLLAEERPVVAITAVKNDRIAFAVEEAIDLLGGIETIARGKTRVILKPNLVAESRDFTTKPEVIGALARLMKAAGKDVVIAEGSAAASGFNAKDGMSYRTSDRELLDRMQQYVFDRLGYIDLAKSLDIPLVNVHSGPMVDVRVPGGRAFSSLTLHRTVAEADLLCSVPMMKTHVMASVTLGMKNLIGLYPGTVYCSVRSCVHERAARAGSPGIAYELIDMVRANRLGLVVVDGSTAMEGDGPTGGQLVNMGVIVAGTNPLATDMVAARLMGFDHHEIPTFLVAQEAGMGPAGIEEIEIRGKSISAVERRFARPKLVRWDDISPYWGLPEKS